MAGIGYMIDSDVHTAAYFDAWMDHLGGLTSKLKAAGYLAVFNTGKYPHAIARAAKDPSPNGWEKFLDALGPNGIYAEDPFLFPDPLRAVDSGWAELEFDSARKLLTRGNSVVYSVPYSMGGFTEPRASQWIAAMCVVLREPGQSLFVATQQDLTAADNPWRTWPGDFGPPTSPATFQTDTTSNWHAYRSFEKGDITIVHTEVHWPKGQIPPQPAAVGLPISTTGLSPAIQPMHGVWDPVAETYAATGQLDALYDGFVLSGQVGARTKLVAVRVYRAET
jgi:hypothetical protein